MLIVVLGLKPAAALPLTNNISTLRQKQKVNINELLPTQQTLYMMRGAIEYADKLSKSDDIQRFVDSIGCTVRISGFYNQVVKQGEKSNGITTALMEGVKKFFGKDVSAANQPHIGIDVLWTGLNDGGDDYAHVKTSVSTQMEATPTVGSHFIKEKIQAFTTGINNYTDTSLSIADSPADMHIVKELNILSGFKVEKTYIIMTVNRLKHNKVRTISTFSINDECTGYIIERDGIPAEKETVEGSLKRIKAGTYGFEITTYSGKEEFKDGKSLRIHKVPGRSGVLVHRGINHEWSKGCLIVVPERFASAGFTYSTAEKKQLEEESQQEVYRVIRYIKDKKEDMEKKYKKDVKMIININQDKEMRD
jgi:hypothetical protein